MKGMNDMFKSVRRIQGMKCMKRMFETARRIQNIEIMKGMDAMIASEGRVKI